MTPTADPTARRAAAEAEADDEALLYWHELELALEELPPVIDGARRTRMIAVDPLTTTWEAWQTTGGQRLLVRCVRPRWRKDPVVLRRLAKADRGATAPRWCPDGDWPHLRVAVDGQPITDRLPAEDPTSTLDLARFVLGALAALGQLHEAGLCHGGPLEACLHETTQGLRLAWLDPFPATHTPADDLRALAGIVVELDPDAATPLAELARGWLEAPPPSTSDAARLVTRSLAGHLLEARHRLSLVRRNRTRRTRIGRLSRATRDLAGSLPPPAGTWCLKASTDDVVILVESDGHTVRGGAAAGAPARFLPTVYHPQRGLDAQASRHLLRSWALRAKGDEDHRRALQQQLGSSDEGAAQLVRWLACTARLRAARLLLDQVS